MLTSNDLVKTVKANRKLTRKRAFLNVTPKFSKAAYQRKSKDSKEKINYDKKDRLIKVDIGGIIEIFVIGFVCCMIGFFVYQMF